MRAALQRTQKSPVSNMHESRIKYETCVSHYIKQINNSVAGEKSKIRVRLFDSSRGETRERSLNFVTLADDH